MQEKQNLRVDKGAASANLPAHVEHFGRRQIDALFFARLSKARDGRDYCCAAGIFRCLDCTFAHLNDAQQVAIGHKLENDEARLLLHRHAHHAHQCLVVQLKHHFGFLHELRLVVGRRVVTQNLVRVATALSQ